VLRRRLTSEVGITISNYVYLKTPDQIWKKNKHKNDNAT